MTQVSDKTLVVLTVIALLTIVGGTITILQHLGPDISTITGFASSNATGTVNVTILATVSIRLTVNHVNFSGGEIVSGLSITELNTTGGAGGGGNPSTFADPGDFQIENDGNVDVNLTINGTNASVWLGGTNPTYRFSSTNPGADDGCSTNRTNTAPSDLNATTHAICLNLSYLDTADTTNVSIYVGIPSDISPGSKSDPAVLIVAAQVISFIGGPI